MRDLMSWQYDEIEELGYNDNDYYIEYFRIFDLLPFYQRWWYHFVGCDSQAILNKALEVQSWLAIILLIR